MIKQAERHFHRVLGTFLLGLIIENDLDGIVISRRDLLDFLDMNKLKAARLNTLLNDIEDLFPEHAFTIRGTASFSRSSVTGRVSIRRPITMELWLCRKPFELASGRMNSKTRSQRMFNASGVKFGILDMKMKCHHERTRFTFDLALSTQLAASLGQRQPDECRQFSIITPKMTESVVASA